MPYKLPSEFSQLSQLVGDRIVRVRRLVLISDEDRENYLENADGPVELTLASGFCFHMVDRTESESILLSEGPLPAFGEAYREEDASSSDFWLLRLRQPIAQVLRLQSLYATADRPGEFGLEFHFHQAPAVTIEHLDEEDWPDMMRLTGPYAGPPCQKIPV